MQSDLAANEQPEMWMFEVPWALSAHLKNVVKRRKNPSSSDETDWDDEDEFSRNELVDETDWR